MLVEDVGIGALVGVTEPFGDVGIVGGIDEPFGVDVDVACGQEVVGVAHRSSIALPAVDHQGPCALFVRQRVTTGIDRGPRTWPPAHVTRAGSTSSNSGMRASHSSTATRSSMRARFEPAQRWMPAPKAR